MSEIPEMSKIYIKNEHIVNLINSSIGYAKNNNTD